MYGTIGFVNHRIRCIIGVHPAEREREQEIFVDLRVAADFSACVQTDALADTVDYLALASLCTNLAVNNRYRLLETFAADVAAEVLRYATVHEVSIKIKKPGALPTADFSVVELSKKKD